MKKLVLFAAFVVAVAFSACSSKTQETAPEAEAPAAVEEPATPAPAAEEAPADTAAVQTPAAQ